MRKKRKNKREGKILTRLAIINTVIYEALLASFNYVLPSTETNL